MNILIWNLRGMISSKSRLLELRKHYNPSILVLIEPFVSVNKIRCWARHLRFSHYASNIAEGGKVWMFWEKELSFSLISSSD